MHRARVATLGGALLALLVVAPASAHGDHDARPLARGLAAAPYLVSLWQVYPDAGDAMAPHLIVVFDGAPASPPAAEVRVRVNGTPIEAHRSPTTANAWETSVGLAPSDVLAVTIAEGTRTWHLEPVIVPATPTSMLPMRELLIIAIALTAVAAVWLLARTTRAWRRPAFGAG